MLSASFAHNSARDQAEATAPMPARKVLREQIMAHLGVNNREHGCRIRMTVETIGMQIHRVVALVAELSFVLVALAATAQRDLVPDSLAHSFVTEFTEKDPVVLPHPDGVANAALRGIGCNLQKRLWGGEYRGPRKASHAIREWRENNDTRDHGNEPRVRSIRTHSALLAPAVPCVRRTPWLWSGRSCGQTWSKATARLVQTPWRGGRRTPHI